MVTDTSLVVNGSILAPSDIPLDSNDVSLLSSLWQRCQDEYLKWVMTRKGTSPAMLRKNTRKTYAVAITQFFGGIDRDLHPLHERDILQAGDSTMIWPSVTPWTVTTDTARRYKLVLSEVGRPVRGMVELSNGKRVKSELERVGLSESSINLKLAALKGFFDFVSKQFEIPFRPNQHQRLFAAGLLHPDETGYKVLLRPLNWRNPFDSKIIGQYKVDTTPAYFTQEEVAKFFAEIDTDTPTGIRDFALYLTLWSTACRIGEIIGMRWGDIQPTSTHYQFGFRGKSGKFERVELKREVYQTILNYLVGVGRLDKMTSDSPVFTAVYRDCSLRLSSVREAYPNGIPDDAPIGYNTVVKSIKKYARRAGIDPTKAHAHAFRHGRGRHMIESMIEKHGHVDIYQVNRILRHNSLDMTRHYTDMMTDPEDEWADDAVGIAMSGCKKATPSDADELAMLRSRVAELEKLLDK